MLQGNLCLCLGLRDVCERVGRWVCGIMYLYTQMGDERPNNTTYYMLNLKVLVNYKLSQQPRTYNNRNVSKIHLNDFNKEKQSFYMQIIAKGIFELCSAV